MRFFRLRMRLRSCWKSTHTLKYHVIPGVIHKKSVVRIPLKKKCRLAETIMLPEKGGICQWIYRSCMEDIIIGIHQISCRGQFLLPLPPILFFLLNLLCSTQAALSLLLLPSFSPSALQSARATTHAVVAVVVAAATKISDADGKSEVAVAWLLAWSVAVRSRIIIIALKTPSRTAFVSGRGLSFMSSVATPCEISQPPSEFAPCYLQIFFVNRQIFLDKNCKL